MIGEQLVLRAHPMCMQTLQHSFQVKTHLFKSVLVPIYKPGKMPKSVDWSSRFKVYGHIAALLAMLSGQHVWLPEVSHDKVQRVQQLSCQAKRLQKGPSMLQCGKVAVKVSLWRRVR